MHPVAGLFGRADTAVAEMVELIEPCQLDFELQCVALLSQRRNAFPAAIVNINGAAGQMLPSPDETSRHERGLAAFRLCLIFVVNDFFWGKSC